jgi:hypothetical protein
MLLSSTMLVGALTGYGGRAYAACVASPSPNYVCSGANAATITINVDNAAVSTLAGFSITAAADNALEITGAGALSYIDTNASPLTAPATALLIQSTGDIALGNPGSVYVKTNGMLTGGADGIFARNYGSLALTVTANGDVKGTAPAVTASMRGTLVAPISA